MPIKLTRREAAKAGLFGGMAFSALSSAGCLKSDAFRGAKPVAGLDSILVLSDTHIAADRATRSRSGVQMWHRLHKLMWEEAPYRQYVFGLPLYSYRFALVNGDAAYDTGEAGDYQQLESALSLLLQDDVPVHVLLGNHDDRDKFQAHVDNARVWLEKHERVGEESRSDMSVEPPSELTNKYVRIIGANDGSRYCDWLLLDSLRIVDETPGELEAAQLAWMDEALGRSPDRPAIIVVHHPPIPDDDPDRPFALQDHEAFWAIVEQHPNVKAVLHGHTHRWEPRKWELTD
ncbi:MAG: metallophosphoesterase, partial [Planctomycetota bacterium]